ncbi:hypothetical protein EON80_05775 [bacterium]|nr:MAG: hypothetical protein EON80_05775 [bacterium]
MYPRNTFRLATGLALMAALFGASLGFSAAPSAQAQGGATAARGPIEIELTAFKVVKGENGKDQFVDAKKAKPGDILEYRAVYANISNKGVKNLQANLPIPSETALLIDSIVPKTALASTDTRNFAAPPLMRNVKLPDGSTQSRPVPASSYRMLRWPIGSLAAGDSVTLRARVRLNSANPAAN